jgi:hypothetical protein
MRYQKTALRGSRPEGLGHPRPTLHTLESYTARVKGGGRSTLWRLARILRQSKS